MTCSKLRGDEADGEDDDKKDDDEDDLRKKDRSGVLGKQSRAQTQEPN